ncbi:MAG: phosphate/phosphite/phosphonate ABC transporter substrate-binding protein [Roseinatronobacter sp.]
MTGLATLPMYDWPEVRGQVDRFYAELRARVRQLPAALTRPGTPQDLHALWRDAGLVFGQTCWGPMQAGLAAHVHVLAQPLYDDVPGGKGMYYRSAIVMRGGRACPPPAHDAAELPDGLMEVRPAINALDSMSGFIAVAQDMGARDLESRALITGSHRASVRAVAEGAADFAAIDCRSWAMALAHESAARGLTVTGWTAPRPGLPYITARATPLALRRALASALAELGAEPHPQRQPEETP